MRGCCYSSDVVVFFRLAFAVVASLFKKRVGLMDQTLLRMRIWPNDLDLNVHANSGRYLSFMDVGRMDFLARMKLLRKVVRRGWRPIAGGAMISYRKSLLPFEAFTVKSRLLSWDEKWFYFEHVIENGKGELSAIATVRGLFLSDSGKVAPAEFLSFAGQPGLASPALPEFIVRWREAEAAR